MKRRKRHQTFERAHHRVVDARGLNVKGPTVNDAVADSREIALVADMVGKPGQDRGDRSIMR